MEALAEMKYYEDGTWVGELSYENDTIELVIEGTSSGFNQNYKILSEDILKDITKYRDLALERLSFLAKSPDNIENLYQIYFGKVYLGFAAEAMDDGFCFSFNDVDEHTIHTIIFDKYKTVIGYLIHFE